MFKYIYYVYRQAKQKLFLLKRLRATIREDFSMPLSLAKIQEIGLGVEASSALPVWLVYRSSDDIFNYITSFLSL